MGDKKVLKKTGFGILFVAACFMATYILMAFHNKILMVLLAAILVLVSAFLFFYEIFMEKTTPNIAAEELEAAKEKESFSGSNDGEFRLKMTKHMKEMEGGQKELIDVLKNQNALLQSQIDNLEQAIIMLSEKQVNQTKSVIKFNKENARQLAINERETLEYVMMELKKAIEDNAGAVRVAAPGVEEPSVAPSVELEEVGNEELFEVSDLPDDDEYIVPEVSVAEELPVFEEEAVAEELPVFEEEAVMEELAVEEIPAVAEEEEPVAEPFAGLGGDPNAMMSAEDIAKLFAMGAEAPAAEPVEEPVIEEPEFADDLDLSSLFEDMAEGAMEEDVAAASELAEEEKEEAPAAEPLAGLSGDPNAMMTPEDIAKLLASMGQ